MSNGFSAYAITQLLNHCFGVGTFAKPVALKLHLYTTDPHGAADEVDVLVDDTAYAAQSIALDDEGTTQAERNYTTGVITFLATVYGSGAASYDVSHWAIQEGLDIIMAGPFPTPLTRLAGEPLALNAGALYTELTRTP